MSVVVPWLEPVVLHHGGSWSAKLNPEGPCTAGCHREEGDYKRKHYDFFDDVPRREAAGEVS